MTNLNVKAVLNMARLSVPSKINKARLVVEAISVNIGTFVTPSPDLITVTTAIDDLETAWNNAADGGKTLKKIMHDKETVLMKLMNDLTAYVTAVASGDESIIHLASLDVKLPPSRSKQDFTVENGNDTGTVLVSVKAQRGAYYIYQFSTDPAAGWTDAGKINKSKLLVTGLTPITKYWFRVAILDKAGEHPFNEPLSIVVI